MGPTDTREPVPAASAQPPAAAASRGLPRWLVGAALVLAGTGAMFVSAAYDRDPGAAVIGANLPVNAGAGNPLDISSHNSPTLVRDPRDVRRLAVADRIDTPQYSCALHVSSDAGATWKQTAIPLPAGEEPKCYAPDVAYGADGTLYLSFVTLAGRGNVPKAVWLSASRDGGRSLSAPRKVLGRLSFQTRLVADPARPGRLYLTWLDAADVGLFRFTGPGNPIRVVRTDDGGRSWSAPSQLSDPRRGRVVAPAPQVGPRGELYVLYLDLGADRLDYEGGHGGQGGAPYGGRFSLVLARSRDGGASFEQSVVDTGLRPAERFLSFLPPAPSLAVDRTSGRLYAAFEDARLGDADVMLWSLGRGDSTWTGPVRVNDTPEHDGRAQYRPWLSVAPGGRLDVIYYDRRADRADIRNAVSLQSSFDHGRSFSKHVRLSDRSFDSRIGLGSERGIPEIGSRLASLSVKDRAFAVWTDTRNGTQASGKQDLMRAVAVVTKPAELSAPAQDVLRYGGIALVLAGVLLLGQAVARRARIVKSNRSPGA